jgi:hypothetical protein
MYKALFIYVIAGYIIIAASYTTTWLFLNVSNTLRCYVDSCSEPLSTFAWDSHQTLLSGSGLSLSSELFLSKAFDTALKPTKIVPYYYRAMHEHEHDDVTVTTIVTSNRFDALRRLVEQYEGKIFSTLAFDSYPELELAFNPYFLGPISVTVHITSTNITRRTSLLASLHDIYTSSPFFPRWVDVHLVTDTHDRQFNMWRNVARLYARTGWVMMLDVDFAVCTNVRERFINALAPSSPGKMGEVGVLAKSGRAAFVIPAFEYVVQEEGMDWRTFPRDKTVSVCSFHVSLNELNSMPELQSLTELVNAGRIAMFHRSWAPGHNSTSYEHYYAAQPGEIYKVTTYQKSYEPYVIMRRDGPPW